MVELKEIEKVSTVTVARKALKEIRKRNPEKLLKADDVVETAAHPDHPLHGFFEWDDTAAAHQYRLAQARMLIRKLVVSGPDKDSPAVPEYVSLKAERKKPGGGYRETNEVVNSRELLTQLEETAKSDIDGVLKRYEMLKALCEKVRKAAGIQTPKKSAGQRRQSKASKSSAAA